MANRRGVVSAARRRAAQRHADRTHTCPVCQGVMRGNGGWSSHKRMHVRHWVKNGRKTLGLGLEVVRILEHWESRMSR